jgi:hypothetical protein
LAAFSEWVTNDQRLNRRRMVTGHRQHDCRSLRRQPSIANGYRAVMSIGRHAPPYGRARRRRVSQNTVGIARDNDFGIENVIP